jgi:hypothetical protein
MFSYNLLYSTFKFYAKEGFARIAYTIEIQLKIDVPTTAAAAAVKKAAINR